MGDVRSLVAERDDTTARVMNRGEFVGQNTVGIRERLSGRLGRHRHDHRVEVIGPRSSRA